MAGWEFDQFYGTYFDRIARALTLAGGGDRELAHDAAQEGFARALRHWSKVRSMDRPDGWVYVVAMNTMRDYWRRTERRRGRASDPAVPADNTSPVATRVSVREAIATLPPRQREAVVLRYLADLPLADVADAMGCAIGTVKATLHQATQSMRIELDDTEDDDAPR